MGKAFILGTFTCEPIERPLAFWLKSLGLTKQISFGPFNQIFQSLLRQESVGKKAQDINIFLVRFEDWGGNSEKDTALIKEINRNVETFLSLLKTQASEYYAHSIVCVCPSSPILLESYGKEIEELKNKLEYGIESIQNTSLISDEELLTFCKTSYYDEYGDKTGSSPYTSDMYISLGTLIARKICRIFKEPLKVIVLDCDNTLWDGICGEDGIGEIKVSPPFQSLQRFMLSQYKSGVLLCLCSKNNEEDVLEVLNKHPDMLLKPHHFAKYKINWNRKSLNLISLSQELNLGLESFVFIDDSHFECAEVIENCPQVMTIQLPEIKEEIPALLSNIWALDCSNNTHTFEDKNRTLFYSQEQDRQKLQEAYSNFEEFIKSLDLSIQFSDMQINDLPRVLQLLQRTNQFNLTTFRYTEEDIEKMCTNQYSIKVVHVCDRFGNYGLVGVIIYKEGKAALEVDSFLLSCRVLGRGVEHHLISELGKIAKDRNFKNIKLRYKVTDKSKPALNFLNSIQNIKIKKKNYQEYCFTISMEDAIQVNFLNCMNNLSVSTSENFPLALHKEVKPGILKGINLIEITNLNAKLQDSYSVKQYIDTNFKKNRPKLQVEYKAPDSEVESKISAIWSNLLHIEDIGVTDDFFALGGDSLLAVQALGCIWENFNQEISLGTFFEFPTIKYLANQIQNVENSKEEVSSFIESFSKTRALLSYGQNRLWFLEQLSSNKSFYNTVLTIELRGPLEKDNLFSAFKSLIARHQNLRITIQVEEGVPYQIVNNQVSFALDEEDISHLQEKTAYEYINEAFFEEETKEFSLKEGPLIRAKLFRIKENKFILLITLHHLISDGQSTILLLKELSFFYTSFVKKEGLPLENLPFHYIDFSIWQREWLQGKRYENQLSYWKSKLLSPPELLYIPADKERPKQESYRGEFYNFQIPHHLVAKIKFLGEQQQATIFMSLLSCFQAFLYKYSGQDDIIVGTPITSRRSPGTERLIGLFINTLALRALFTPALTFKQLIKQVRQTALEAFTHQDIPFEHLIEGLKVTRHLDRHPVFQVMFGFENPLEPLNSFIGLDDKPIDFGTKVARFDLTLWFRETKEGLMAKFEYALDLFEPSTIVRMSKHFEQFLTNITENPDIPISQISLMTNKETRELLTQVNNTVQSFPSANDCIHLLFERQAEKTPTNMAILFDGCGLTYGELNAKANQLAYYLRMNGVGPEITVAIALERSLDLIIGILAILKAGGSYVPIDPHYPEERIQFILNDLGSPLLLIQPHSYYKFEKYQVSILSFQLSINKEGFKCILIKESDSSLTPLLTPQCNPVSLNQSSNLAYIIYTSGSTGFPKGVMVEHKSIVNFLFSFLGLINIKESDCLVSVTNPTFDIFGLEVYLPLIVGAKVVLSTTADSLSGDSIKSLIEKYGATIMQATPATWELLFASGWKGNQKLKALCGGESLPKHLLDFLTTYHQEAWNVYGPTETTIWSTYKKLNKNSSASIIGRPIHNTFIYIMDASLNLLPAGIVGEIYIGGEGLGRGYWNRPELTKEKFIDNPFITDGYKFLNENNRIYKDRKSVV